MKAINTYTTEDIYTLKMLLPNKWSSNLPQSFLSVCDDNEDSMKKIEISPESDPQEFLMKCFENPIYEGTTFVTLELEREYKNLWGLIFFAPLSSVPLYLNEAGLPGVIVKWRLEINK